MNSLIYFHTDRPLAEIILELVQLLNPDRFTNEYVLTLETSDYYISVLTNQDACDNNELIKFPDDYFHFRYYVEYTPEESLAETKSIEIITKILELFWREGIPAIAESSYDDQLPLNGGYNNVDLPWPSPKL